MMTTIIRICSVCNGGGLKNHGGGSTAEAVLVGVTFSSVLKMGRSDFGDLYYNLAQASSNEFFSFHSLCPFNSNREVQV